MRHGDDILAILCPQPTPEEASVVHFYGVDGRARTAIARLWRRGDPARCRLCDRCQLSGHPESRLCTIVVHEHVPGAGARMFSSATPPRAGTTVPPAAQPVPPGRAAPAHGASIPFRSRIL